MKTTNEDLFMKLNRQIDIVSDTMQQNIDKTMQNMEEFHKLSNSSIQMKENSELFNQRAKKAKRKMYWKNKKIIGVAGSITGLIILIILI